MLYAGYFGNDEATASTLDSEGWLKTGDLCYIDEEGFLFVVDRVKELIKYKAFQVQNINSKPKTMISLEFNSKPKTMISCFWQVAPAELEELLLSNPEISDAAVIP